MDSIFPQEIYGEIIRHVSDGVAFTTFREVCVGWRDITDGLFPRGRVIFAHNLNMVLKLGGESARAYVDAACGRTYANARTRSFLPTRGRGMKAVLLCGETTIDYYLRMCAGGIPDGMWCRCTYDDFLRENARARMSAKVAAALTIYNRGFVYDERIWEYVSCDTEIGMYPMVTDAAVYLMKNRSIRGILVPFTVTNEYIDTLISVGLHDDHEGIRAVMEAPGFTYAFAKKLRGLYDATFTHNPYIDRIVDGWRPQTDDEWVEYYERAEYIHEKSLIMKDIPASAVSLLVAREHIDVLICNDVPSELIPWEQASNGCMYLCDTKYGYVGDDLGPIWCTRKDMDWVWMERILEFVPEKDRRNYIRVYITSEHTYK